MHASGADASAGNPLIYFGEGYRVYNFGLIKPLYEVKVGEGYRVCDFNLPNNYMKSMWNYLKLCDLQSVTLSNSGFTPYIHIPLTL